MWNSDNDKSRRLTLSEYLTSYNLRLKLRSQSKQRKQSSNENKNTLNIPSITKLTRAQMVETLKLTLRSLITDDQEFIKINRMIDRLTQLYTMEVQESKRDKAVLETIIKENQALGVSMLGTQRGVDPSIRKSRLAQTNHHLAQTNHHLAPPSKHKNTFHPIQNQEEAQNLKLTSIKFIDFADKMNKKCEIQTSRFKESQKNMEQQIIPSINILQITRKNGKEQQQTKQTINFNNKIVSTESPAKKSVKWDDELPIQSKMNINESPVDHYQIQTPSTLQRRTQEKNHEEKASKRIMERFESFRKRRQSQQGLQIKS